MAGNDTAYAPGPRQTGVMCQPGWCRPRDFPPADPGGAYSIASTQAAPGVAPQMGWKERRPSISDGRGESLGLAFPVGTGRPRVVTWEVSRPLSRCSSCPWSVSVCVAGDFKSLVQRCLDGGFGSTRLTVGGDSRSPHTNLCLKESRPPWRRSGRPRRSVPQLWRSGCRERGTENQASPQTRGEPERSIAQMRSSAHPVRHGPFLSMDSLSDSAAARWAQCHKAPPQRPPTEEAAPGPGAGKCLRPALMPTLPPRQ